MSVKLRFECPAEVGVVQRSRSFTGFSSLSGRRRVSSVRNSLRSKALSSKSPRMQPSPSRTGGGIWGHQPEQVDRIFQALRKGLKEYLEGHQAEMDFLSSQQRDTKRNSRLAFLYDLEKEIRALERYIRRLEFQISKVEELFETYCIQWRLCQGAVNMKKAFSLSPSSRASRESLLELNRNHRHSLEDMSVMEEELEILLGELHIKMKGLIGFARLCPGDQYEVVVRLGRQRWKIRGKIQTDDRQSWDEEEMIFLPHIHQNFEIKVTEAKGLGSLLVGMVTCKSADFFMARPQLMVVDITELGTVKLHLEVVWNPFESGEMRPITSAPSRLSIPSRKGSVYSWTAPNTPSFTQKYFISMVRQLQDPEGTFSMISGESSRGVSLLNYLGDTSTSPTPTTAYSQAGSLTHISLVENEPMETPPLDGRSRGEDMGEEWPSSDQDTGPSSPSSTPGSLLALQRYSTPDILRQNRGLSPSPSPSPSPGPTMDTESPQVRSNETSQGPTVEARLGYEGPTVEEYEGPGEEVRLGYEDDYEKQHQQHHQAPARPAGSSSSQRRAVALRVSTLLAELEGLLQIQQCTEKELRALDNQIVHLNTILKNNLSLLKKTSSDETLAVEEVLGSFDFLSTDFNADDDMSCMGSIHLKNTGISSFQKNTLRSLGLLSQDSQSPEELDLAPLTTGNCSLDQALETHLGICTVLLEAMRSSESLLVQRDILEEMSLQAEVLEKVSRLMLEKTDMLSANDILPKAQRQRELLVFWEECTEGDSLFCCPVDTFAGTLRKRYIHKVKAKQPGQPYAVFSQLLLQIQAGCRMVPLPRCNQERVTIFQLSTYLSRWGLQDLGEHISCLSREVYLVSCLKSPKRRRALKKLRGRRIAELLPLGSTLQLLAGLQTDGNHKVAQTAANCLCRAAGCKAFRAKAIVYYTEALRESDVQVQQAACLALKCLRATESVDQVAELWRSVDEDLRSAARETVLSFGKKGHIAFQRMDKIYCELQEEAYQNLDTEITIL